MKPLRSSSREGGKIRPEDGCRANESPFIGGIDMEVSDRLRKGDYLLLAGFSLGLFCYACFGGRVLTQHEARPAASFD